MNVIWCNATRSERIRTSSWQDLATWRGFTNRRTDISRWRIFNCAVSHKLKSFWSALRYIQDGGRLICQLCDNIDGICLSIYSNFKLKCYFPQEFVYQATEKSQESKRKNLKPKELNRVPIKSKDNKITKNVSCRLQNCCYLWNLSDSFQTSLFSEFRES